jgi:hypothetical protein
VRKKSKEQAGPLGRAKKKVSVGLVGGETGFWPKMIYKIENPFLFSNPFEIRKPILIQIKF